MRLYYCNMLKANFNASPINQMYSLLNQLIMASYGFILLFTIVRLLPQAEVGRWLLFISAISISDMLMQGLLQTIVVKEIAMKKDNVFQIHQITNNALLLAISFYLILILIILLTNGFFHFITKDFLLLNDFSFWYPLFGLLMIIYNLSWWVNTGKVNFKFILIQRIIYCSISLLFIWVIYLLNYSFTFQIIVISQVIGYGVSAAFALFINKFIFHRKYISIELMRKYISYGKFTIGTMLGSSLLRNADVFMIAAMMNSSAVAIYTLAQKIIEVFEVVLRSLAATFLPVLQHYRNDVTKFSQILMKRTLTIMVLFIPLAVLFFFLSNTVIQIISGSQSYNLSSLILKVFMLYVLLLPLDRFMGVALEASHLPHLNLIKTIFLITVNISGNYIALHYFNSLTGVAAASSIALLTGISTGYYFLKSSGILIMSKINLQQSLMRFKLS